MGDTADQELWLVDSPLPGGNSNSKRTSLRQSRTNYSVALGKSPNLSDPIKGMSTNYLTGHEPTTGNNVHKSTQDKHSMHRKINKKTSKEEPKPQNPAKWK